MSKSRVSHLCLLFLLMPAMTTVLSACSTSSKPCSAGGDVTWNPPLKGNRQCYQVKDADGKYINQGKYVEWYKNGNMALEGQFKDGFKDGVWIQYDETGRKVMEKLFRNGVETNIPKSGIDSMNP